MSLLKTSKVIKEAQRQIEDPNTISLHFNSDQPKTIEIKIRAGERGKEIYFSRILYYEKELAATSFKDRRFMKKLVEEFNEMVHNLNENNGK